MIVIMTDFGDSEYLGVIKGIICSIAPNAKITDLCNSINSCSTKEGAWVLYNNCRYFPKGSIFLCIVDPGVGSQRKCLAVKTKNYYFVGPDNGLMHEAIIADGVVESVELSAEGASKTFHGRDVFAKAAARLENGEQVSRLGAKSVIKEKLGFYLSGRKGEVVRIDHFGNIITNLPSLGKKQYDLKFNNSEKKLDFFSTYQEAGQELFAILGSSNSLEISLKNGNASCRLGLKVGDKIELL